MRGEGGESGIRGILAGCDQVGWLSVDGVVEGSVRESMDFRSGEYG